MLDGGGAQPAGDYDRSPQQQASGNQDEQPNQSSLADRIHRSYLIPSV